jgi:hypothetical protein
LLRIRPARWAAILLTAFALLAPAAGLSGNTAGSAVVADAPVPGVVVGSAPAPGDMIWG